MALSGQGRVSILRLLLTSFSFLPINTFSYRRPYDELLLDVSDKYLSVEDASVSNILKKDAARNCTY